MAEEPPTLDHTAEREDKGKQNSNWASTAVENLTFTPYTHTNNQGQNLENIFVKNTDVAQKMLVETSQQLQDPTSRHSAAGSGGRGWKNLWREGLASP